MTNEVQRLIEMACPRSPQWPARERAHLLVQPTCLVCGHCGNIKLNVHHKYPFHFVIGVGRPDLELDERNLYTLCVDHSEDHHLLVGHLDSFESYNPDLEHFIALCKGLTAAQIRSMREWVDAVAVRPRPLHEMIRLDKEALKAELDKYMPLRA